MYCPTAKFNSNPLRFFTLTGPNNFSHIFYFPWFTVRNRCACIKNIVFQRFNINIWRIFCRA